jgi:hypothetical protein
MSIIEIARIQVRRGQEGQNRVPQLEPGEFGWAQDTEHLYIGKRISEGASDDNNTKILTENDLKDIFNFVKAVNTSSATTSTFYSYRTGTNYLYSPVPGPISRTIQSKLDETVSLEDFGVVPSFTATDISAEFQLAVNTIYYNSTWNSYARQDARRELIIPPGNYFISTAVELPPYATLIGEGPELTKLTLVSSTTNIFRTVDADGNFFEEGMQSGIKRSRSVSIKNLTLEYSPNHLSDNPLVAVDNVLDFSIDNCILRTAFTATTTSTYGLVNSGIGIGIRGTGGGLGSGDTNLCENVRINNCQLDGLYIGVRGTGTVIRPVITESIFSNLNRGVEFYTTDLLPGPSNGLIKNNRFQNIVRESIFVGENPEQSRTNHISENNFFIQAGNGTGLDDRITTSSNSTAIIKFNSQGNKSINDYFHRRTVGNQSSSTFYYAPLVQGYALVNSVELTTSTIVATSSTVVTKIPFTGSDQYITIKYQLFNADHSRKGELDLNISADGYPMLTDNYNFSETIPIAPIYFEITEAFSSSGNYLGLVCVNESTQLTMVYSIDTMV